VICKKRLLAAQNISRIYRNAVWTKDGCATENTYYDEEEDYNIHKDEKSHHLRCSGCHNHVGWFCPNFHDRGQKSKLLYIDRDGNNVMTVHATSSSNNNNNDDDGDVNEALAKHVPLMDGREGFKSLDTVTPWPRGGVSVTKRYTERRYLQSIGEDPTDQSIEDINTKLGRLEVRKQLENHSLKKCPVCRKNNWDTRIQPCGHVCCLDCAHYLQPPGECPVCHKPKEDMKKVYRS
jgi:hypothetical protein